jgi:hypothetical protein
MSTVQLAQTGLYENPDPWTYVVAGYGLCLGGIIAYTAALMVRGRRLARQVPPDEQRWMPPGGGERKAPNGGERKP